MKIIYAHTFINTITGQSMDVYTTGNQSAFVAMVNTLRAARLPVEYVWKLQGNAPRRLISKG